MDTIQGSSFLRSETDYDKTFDTGNNSHICYAKFIVLEIMDIYFVLYTNWSVTMYFLSPLGNIFQKKLIEKSRECHNHKPQPTPDSKRKRKMTNTNTYKANKQMHEKHGD